MNKFLRGAALALLGSTALVAAAPASAAHMQPRPHPMIHRPLASPHFVHRSWAFRGHFSHFTPYQRSLWTRGHWWHGWHHGHRGWWWWANGGWFFYTAPIYPYPLYTSDVYYYDRDYDHGSDYDGPAGDRGSWYHCANPEGYYPYVKSCRSDWERVAPRPVEGMDRGSPDQHDMNDQGPDDDRGPPPGDGYRDNGPGNADQDDSDDSDNSDDNGPPPPH